MGRLNEKLLFTKNVYSTHNHTLMYVTRSVAHNDLVHRRIEGCALARCWMSARWETSSVWRRNEWCLVCNLLQFTPLIKQCTFLTLTAFSLIDTYKFHFYILHKHTHSYKETICPFLDFRKIEGPDKRTSYNLLASRVGGGELNAI